MAEAVYRVTRDRPREEIFGFTSQVRRAAVSVPSNIAEGRGRGSSRDFVRFLYIAHSSLWEVETHLVVAERIGYLSNDDRVRLEEITSDIGRLLNGLIRATNASIHEDSPDYDPTPYDPIEL